jgi:superfamily I DNA/RNA helicase
MTEIHRINIDVKGLDINEGTRSMKGLLKSYISRNPSLPLTQVEAEPRIGIIHVNDISRVEMEDYLSKASQELATSCGCVVKYDIETTDTDSEPITAQTEIELPPHEIVPEGSHVDTSRSGVYKLLLTKESMSSLAELPREAINETTDILHQISQGDWEQWGRGANPGFASWREADEGVDTLFTLEMEGMGTLVWSRAYSVDLFGRLAYPVGAYYDSLPPENFFAPHIVLHTLLPPDQTPKFQFNFEGRLFKDEVGLENESLLQSDPPNDEIAYKEELYLLSHNRIRDLLNGIQQGLPLHLSEEQISVLGIPGPVLLSGEAGSGKTNVITQWLVINHLRQLEIDTEREEPLVQLFVTFSNRLRDRTRDEFETMLPAAVRNHRTEFKTYRELLEEILTQEGLISRFNPSDEMDFERFMKEYASGLTGKHIDPVLLWDEIRSVIKGGPTPDGVEEGGEAVSIDFMDITTYKRLSDTRGQCKTPQNLRDEYYDAAQAYQNNLVKNGFWDGIDLARACLRICETATKYERVACDEVQDLAPIEIYLLLQLAGRDVANLFFTGDVAQVINPSGFRWSRLKSELGAIGGGRRVPDIQYLKRNYRSCFEIVDLINKVLDFRRDLLNDDVSKVRQEPLLPARVRPMVLKSSPVDLLVELESNPNRRLILTKTEKERRRIEGLLGEAKNGVTILTIEEAKGLEYDGVLLWNFFLPRHDLITRRDWEQVFIADRRNRLQEDIASGEKNTYGITYEFNLLHVGLSRGRRLMFVYDEDPRMQISNLSEGVAESLAAGDDEDFRMHWMTEAPSPVDLYNAGTRLLNRDSDQAKRLFLLAAKDFEKNGYSKEAARCYEDAEAFDNSAACHLAAGDEINSHRVMARYHESNLEWTNAGKMKILQAEQMFEAGSHSESAEAYEDAKKYFEHAGEIDSAVKAAVLAAESLPNDRPVDRARMFDRAAEFASRSNRSDEAIKSYDRSITIQYSQENLSMVGLHIDIMRWLGLKRKQPIHQEQLWLQGQQRVYGNR